MSSDRNSGPILRISEGPLAGKTFELRSPPVVVGRHKDCQIVLPAETVSKKHAAIRREGLHLVVEDLGSRNETQLNGVTIKGPTKLRDGDRISICGFQLQFEDAGLKLEKDDESSSTILGSIELTGSTQFLPRARPADTLKAVLEMIREIGSSLQYREVLDKTLSSLFTIFPQADRGFVLLSEAGSPCFVPQATRFRSENTAPLTLSTTVYAHVMEEGKAILSTNVPKDLRFISSGSIHGAAIRTMMCVPLFSRDHKPMGMIQIDTQEQRSKFSPEDLDVLAAVAGPVALAVENARLHDNLVNLSTVAASLKNAHAVQLALLPDTRPDLVGYEFWDAYEPAQAVGGDYFDYLRLARDDGSHVWAISIGDVSGKGMPAALLVAKLSSEVRTCLLSESKPEQAMERLNRQLYDERFPDRFITFLLIVLDATRHTMTVVNAGHMGPMIRRANGSVEVVGQEENGPALTILETAEYRSVETSLDSGDVVVLYTDGVDEAMNSQDRCFHASGIIRMMKAAPAGAAAVGEAILEAVKSHAGTSPQSDDIGIVCFGRI